MIDRISVRERPSGYPVLHQRWSRLVFLHVRVGRESLRPLVPSALSLDAFEEETWVSLVAFTVTGMRASLLPPVPGLSSAHQINLRTYVHCEGVPGLWFFSLDATNRLAVRAARLVYRLPYYLAQMEVSEIGNSVSFSSERVDPKATPAVFRAECERSAPMAPAEPGSLEFFLVERYVLFAGTTEHLLRARIHHRPWPLQRATLIQLESNMLAAQGLETPDRTPLVHAQRQPFDVSIWAPTVVAAASRDS